MSSKLAFAGARWRYPTHNGQVFSARGNTASLCLVVSVTPDYVTRDHRFFMPGFWFLGGTQYETPMNNPYQAAFSIDMGLTGSWLDGTLAGNRVDTITGLGRWTDRGLITANIPPRTPYAMLWLTGVNDGEWKMGGVGPNFGPLGHPEAIQISSDFEALLENLNSHIIDFNVTNPFGANSAMLVPSHAVALAPLGARSVLATGDSIEYGWHSTTYDASNNLGMIARGLDGWGAGVNVVGYPGAKLATEAASDTSASFVKRAQVLNLLGQLPFDTLLTNAGTNDLMAAASLAALQGMKLAELARFRGLFPGLGNCRVQTLTPRSSGDFSTISGQTPQAKCAVGGLMFQFNDWLRGSAGDGCLDIQPALWAQNNPNSLDPVDIWRCNSGPATPDGVHLTDHGSDLGSAAIQALAVAGALG